MKSISAIHPAITKNMEDMLVKCAPIHVSEYVKAITPQFQQCRNIVRHSMRSASAIFMSRTEAITCLRAFLPKRHQGKLFSLHKDDSSKTTERRNCAHW